MSPGVVRPRSRHALRVDHQYHRGIKHPRQCGIGIPPFQVDAVVKPLVGFHQTDIRIRPLADEEIAHFVRLLRVEIEVVAVAA